MKAPIFFIGQNIALAELIFNKISADYTNGAIAQVTYDKREKMQLVLEYKKETRFYFIPNLKPSKVNKRLLDRLLSFDNQKRFFIHLTGKCDILKTYPYRAHVFELPQNLQDNRTAEIMKTMACAAMNLDELPFCEYDFETVKVLKNYYRNRIIADYRARLKIADAFNADTTKVELSKAV